MRKLMIIAAVFVLIFLNGCSSSSDLEFQIETAPKHKAGTSYPIVVQVSKGGEPAEGVKLSAHLEMARMDHGTIEASFTDIGDGLYESSLELPMGGEWIANIEAEIEGKSFEQVVTFEVVEE